MLNQGHIGHMTDQKQFLCRAREGVIFSKERVAFSFRSIYQYGKVTILVRISNRTRICYLLTRFW